MNIAGGWGIGVEWRTPPPTANQNITVLEMMYGIHMHGDWIAEFQMIAEFRKDAKGAVLQHRSIHTELLKIHTFP